MEPHTHSVSLDARQPRGSWEATSSLVRSSKVRTSALLSLWSVVLTGRLVHNLPVGQEVRVHQHDQVCQIHPDEIKEKDKGLTDIFDLDWGFKPDNVRRFDLLTSSPFFPGGPAAPRGPMEPWIKKCIFLENAHTNNLWWKDGLCNLYLTLTGDPASPGSPGGPVNPWGPCRKQTAPLVRPHINILTFSCSPATERRKSVVVSSFHLTVKWTVIKGSHNGTSVYITSLKNLLCK